jgi:hypothetical protein
MIEQAYFDTLAIANKLDAQLEGGFKQEEIHLFSYFSSILFLFKGKPLADWGYQYQIDSRGYPFALQVAEAIERDVQNVLFEPKDEYLVVLARGADQFNKLRLLTLFREREEVIDAACTTGIVLPYSSALRALLSEPEIEKRRKLQDTSWLDQTEIYPKFLEISKAVGISSENLVISAATWIDYLSTQDTGN